MSKDNGTKTDAAPTLLGLLETATAADLADVDQKIAALEGERDTVVTHFENKLASLKAVRKIIDVWINGQPERKQKKAKAARESAATSSPEANGKRLRIARLIGPTQTMLSAVIAQKLGFPDARAIGQLIQHEWFDRSVNGITLSDKGRREALV